MNMPELPEVETIRRDLNQVLPGLVILDATVKKAKVINDTPKRWVAHLRGQSFTKLERKGKVLQLGLSSGEWLVVHLKLTGQLIAQCEDGQLAGGGHPIKANNYPNVYTRLILTCSNQVQIYFNDMRMFGWCHVLTEEERQKILSRLGPDALDDSLDATHLKNYARCYPQRSVKQMLLDQSWLAGLGNIYADEVCFYARVRPDRLLSTLTSIEKTRVWQGVRMILNQAIENRGTTFQAFRDGYGRVGQFAQYLMVYGRTGQACKRCSTSLTRARVAQRGTHYCPKCQL